MIKVNGLGVSRIPINEKETLRIMKNGQQLWSGSGLPAGYTLLDYIQSDGSSYIDSLYSGNETTKIETKADTSNGDFYIALNQTNARIGIYLVQTGRLDIAFGASGYKGLVLTGLSEPALIILENGKAIGNNREYTFTKQSSFQQTSTIKIFGESSKGRCYYCKFYNNGNLVRDFIPCKNPSGVCGLYDKVNKVFYKSASGIPFTGA